MGRQNLAATEVVDSVAHEDEREKRHKRQAKAAGRRDMDSCKTRRKTLG